MDDQSRAEEELRFEERVRKELRDARLVRADADAHDHVADLRHRRVGQYSLDIPLRRAEDRAEQRGDGADGSDQELRFVAGASRTVRSAR